MNPTFRITWTKMINTVNNPTNIFTKGSDKIPILVSFY